ncbi:hypothetical protein ABW19_dt0202067 [Dactylella cylindrospora]|nr:hypothetical protein ABW19_dt0202067 [Dactylella cylindrospora]
MEQHYLPKQPGDPRSQAQQGAGASSADPSAATKPPDNNPTQPQNESQAQNQPPSSSPNSSPTVQAPSITLPKGGGAIRSLTEKYDVDISSGSGTYSIAIPTTTSRPSSAFQDAGISLSYTSNGGSSHFGLGWDLSIQHARISRKFDKGVPRYRDTATRGPGGVDLVNEDEDVFIINGLEDLVRTTDISPADGTDGYIVRSYKPRIEGSFLRIEWWVKEGDASNSFWKIMSKTNEVSIYGRDKSSRIYQDGKGQQPDKIFSWLLSESYDTKGNAILFGYKAEDAAGILPELEKCEWNREDEAKVREKYLKSIKYGNRKANRTESNWEAFSASQLGHSTWMFEVVFDFGEHDEDNPKTNDNGTWKCRKDVYSSYRSGFEVRTYRLCQRILMFHHFPEQFARQDDVLVMQWKLEYEESEVVTYLKSVTQTGFDTDETNGLTISKKSLPPVAFDYSRFPEYDDTVLPHYKIIMNEEIGFPVFEGSNTAHQWIDLDGEGIPGVLYTNQTTNETYYYQNISGLGTREVKFLPPKVLSSRPALPVARGTFMDVAGNGSQDLVDLQTPGLKGYYERKDVLEIEDDGWGLFHPFQSFPSSLPPDYQLIDLSGDGLPDILIMNDQIFKWYSCLPKGEGYNSQPEWNYASWDEGTSPRVVFTASNDIRIFLADASGDGLVDIVRVRRDGEVCYWPNMGYANWGRKVLLGKCAWPDSFSSVNISRVYLADIDGSGTSDIVYVSDRSVALFRNQSGNSLSDPILTPFVSVNGGRTDFIDLFGNGTSCLVISSIGDDSFAYLDFSGGNKPHLMHTADNGVGMVRTLTYSSSTKFYLWDKLQGRHWITKLSFPVNCVESIEVTDSVSGNKFVTRYAYHHGYFDGEEREFRGFAAVDTWDTEANTTGLSWRTGPSSHVKTWLHTGVWMENDEVSRMLAREYFGAPSVNDQPAFSKFLESLLPDTVLPIEAAGWSPGDIRQACRSLKSKVLRRETYGEDLSLNPKANIPFQAQEMNYIIKRVQNTVQPVFFTHEMESMTYHYERKLEDPRISYEVVTEVDEYGNLKTNFQISYGRIVSDLAEDQDKQEQERNVIAYSKKEYTQIVDDKENYVLPVPFEAIDYQIHDETLALKRDRLNLADILNLPQKPNLDYTAPLNGGILNGKRKIEHSITLYRKDDMTGLLPMGEAGTLGLPGETYRLAIAPDIFTRAYQDLPDPEFSMSKLVESGYVDLLNNGNYWLASGRQFYSISSNPAAELLQAKQTFFLPVRYVDPLGRATIVEYDAADKIRPTKSTDALGNQITAKLDYRVMAYKSVTDVNGNSSEVRHDELNRVIATVRSGKEGEGDSFARFQKYPTQALLDNFYEDPQGSAAQDLLGSSSSRCIYNTSTIPIHCYTISRETHESDLSQGSQTEVRVHVSHSDGFGREIQTVVQCEPSTINEGDPGTPNKKWICSGWTIYNNKGLAVRKFEPFYQESHTFSQDAVHGVSPYIFHDALGRVVGTYNPNHSWNKTTFDSWKQITYDENDTVQLTPDPNDPRTDPDVGGYFQLFTDEELGQTWYVQRMAPGSPLGPREVDAAKKAAVHNNTPGVAHLNALGQQFLSVVKIATKYSNDEEIPTFELSERVKFDIEGNRLGTYNPEGWLVERKQYNLLSTALTSEAADSGQAWTHQNCVGSVLYTWDSRGYRFRDVHDDLNRPVESYMLDLEAPEPRQEKMVGKTIYGETDTDPTSRNVRLQPVRRYDQAGLVVTNQYDFKGNPKLGRRQYAAEYRQVIDHSSPFVVDPRLPTLETETTFDAQNRVLSTSSPTVENVRSVVYYTYNRTGLLGAVSATLKGDASSTPLVKNIQYDAKGQRYSIEYGNGTSTAYTYDKFTFKLRRVFTKRGSRADFPGDCPDPPLANNPGCQIQNLWYFYDAVENVTYTQDDAQQTIFFRGNRVEPSCDYTYDSLNRLIRATGREHLGQPNTNGPTPPSIRDRFHTRLDLPSNSLAMGTYIEKFYYDKRNNIEKVRHGGSDPQHEGWTRDYFYNEPNPLQPPGGNPSQQWKTDRLSSTKIGNTEEVYHYDGRAGRAGNITSMANLRSLEWDWKNKLHSSSQQVFNGGTPETTYYVYDFTGSRIRKVTDYQTPNGEEPKTKSDRIYAGTIFERYVEYLPQSNASPSRVEETIQIYDGAKRIAGIESIRDFQGGDPPETRLFRYQLSNYTESSSIELDDKGGLISYEEYFPFGATSYQGTRSQLEIPKRYRFASKERDDETGLDFSNARYYASWLGRWISPDPGGLVDGTNRYSFTNNNPTGMTDPTGTEGLQLNMPKFGGESKEEKIARQVNPERLQLKTWGAMQIKSLTTLPNSIRFGDPDNPWAPFKDFMEASNWLDQQIKASTDALDAKKAAMEKLETGFKLGSLTIPNPIEEATKKLPNGYELGPYPLFVGLGARYGKPEPKEGEPKQPAGWEAKVGIKTGTLNPAENLGGEAELSIPVQGGNSILGLKATLDKEQNETTKGDQVSWEAGASLKKNPEGPVTVDLGVTVFGSSGKTPQPEVKHPADPLSRLGLTESIFLNPIELAKGARVTAGIEIKTGNVPLSITGTFEGGELVGGGSGWAATVSVSAPIEESLKKILDLALPGARKVEKFLSK